jgi:hypothetical protein
MLPMPKKKRERGKICFLTSLLFDRCWRIDAQSSLERRLNRRGNSGHSG